VIAVLLVVPILAAGAYLIALGVAAFVAPAQTRTFLGAHASTLRAHLLELALRLLVGSSLIATAPQMWMPEAFSALGWVLVVTSLCLLALPWRWHRRFSQWSVPQATARLPLLGAASITGGAVVLWAL
jgi:uncharacterized protein YjeT (DUF2065 family)